MSLAKQLLMENLFFSAVSLGAGRGVSGIRNMAATLIKARDAARVNTAGYPNVPLISSPRLGPMA